MQKDDIVQLLDEKHQEFIDWLRLQDEDKWTQGLENKWTTGQHALHLLQSIKMLNNAMSMPKFLLKFKFGSSNRDVRDYDAVVNRYKERLDQIEPGATFGPPQNMKTPKKEDKDYLLDRIQTENKKLQYKTKKWSDKQLDKYILPHPLMGKMPVREIIMWTAYHVEHHTNTLKKSY